MYTQRLRDPYIKALKHYFLLDVVVVVAKHQEVYSSSVPLCMYNLLYIHICNIASLYIRHVGCMCDVFRIYMHAQMPTSNFSLFQTNI